MSGVVPLPGVSIVVRIAGVVKAATSTDLDGVYDPLRARRRVRCRPIFPGFTAVDRELTFGAVRAIARSIYSSR